MLKGYRGHNAIITESQRGRLPDTIFLAIYLFILFIIFFVADKSLQDPYTYGKYFYFTILLATLSIGICIKYIYSIYQNKQATIALSGLDLLLIIYSAYLTINNAVRGTYSDNIIPAIIGLVSIIMVRRIVQANNSMVPFALLIALTVSVLYSSLQLLGIISHKSDFYLLTGVINNPGPLGIWFAVLIPVVLYFIDRSNGKIRILLFVLLASSLLHLFLSLSRAGWVACIVSALFIYSYRLTIFKARFRRYPLYSVSLIAFLIAALIYGGYKLKPESALGRLTTWQVGISMIKDNVWTGHGIGGFERLSGLYLSKHLSGDRAFSDREIIRAERTRYAFNDLIQITAEQGVIGLSFILTIVICIFRIKINNRTSFAWYARGALAGLLASSLFSYPCEVPSLWTLLLLFISVISANDDNKRMYATIKMNSWIVGAIVISSVIIVVYQADVYVAKRRANIAYSLFTNGQLSQSTQVYDEIYEELCYDYNVVAPYSKALFLQKEYVKSVAILDKTEGVVYDPFIYITKGSSYEQLDMIDKAEAAFKFASSIDPKLMYPKYLLVKLYMKEKKMKNACTMANEILKMTVKVNSNATNFMKAEVVGIAASCN